MANKNPLKPTFAVQDDWSTRTGRNLRLQVLLHEDVVENIFPWFVANRPFGDEGLQDKRRTRQALLYACLTCRAFVIPALNVLWGTFGSLGPLLKLLPSSVKVNSSYTVDGEVQPAQVKRFEIYARKIRTLSIESWTDVVAVDRVLKMFKLSFFPALKAIDICTPFDVDYLTPLFLADKNSLRKVTVNSITSQRGSLVSSFLYHVLDKVPDLQALCLSGDFSFQILDNLKHFKNLRMISLEFTSSILPLSRVLQDLRDMPELLHLCVDIKNHALPLRSTTLPTIKDVKTFPAPQVLEICGNVRTVDKMLKADFLPSEWELRNISLKLTIEKLMYYVFVQGCVDQAVRIAPNLRTFDLRLCPGPDSDSPKITIPSQSTLNLLRPFMQCHQLASLKLSNLEYSITDAQICEIAESGAWENLQVLDLPPHCPQGPGASLTSLIALAQNCPKLTHVSIPIDFSLHTPPSRQEEQQKISGPWCQTPHRRLEFLKIWNVSSIINPTTDMGPTTSTATKMMTAGVRFLEHCFPGLRSGSMILENCDQTDLKSHK